MPIDFTCPQCGARTNVADEYAGQTGPCSRCGATITVPPLAGPAGYTSGPTRSLPAVVILVLVLLGVLIACGGILSFLLLPAVGASREAARRAACTNNLKQIGLALQNYEATNGQFPPAYVADKDGKPLLSWRVLILPYMEQKPLYDQFNHEEPWDSPQNSVLANGVIPQYRCPSDPDTTGVGAGETSYVMIVGPGTISDGASATKLGDIKDGVSRTIMIVEVANSGIKWSEPRDLKADEISFRINDGSARGISSHHVNGACVLMCDGSVHFLSSGTAAEQIKAMTTIAGGEAVGPPD